MKDVGKAKDPIAAALGARSRGEVKEAGVWLDRAGPETRRALVDRAVAGGAPRPEDWEELDGKRLLRALLDREDAARVRTTPIARDEAFTCARCGREVPLGGRRPRDHCPTCLHSLHVDVVPGDRAAGCGGLLVPQAVEPLPKGLTLRYRCAACGAERRNRVLDDVDPPDSQAAVLALMRARAHSPD